MTTPPLTLTELRALVTAAGAAPSLHNSQPWLFRPAPDGSTVRVYADAARAVPVTDPDGRARYISVGAALFNLRVAAAHLWREAEVRLLPDETDPDLVAEVDLTRTARPQLRDLYAAIHLRHSAREPFANRDVPEAVFGELVAAAGAQGAVLVPLEEAAVRRVLALTAEAEQRTESDVARQAETRHWLRLERPATDGIPATALGSLDREGRVPMRSFTGRPPLAIVPTHRFEALPQLATFTTGTDHPVDWVRAGQALEHVWLLATAHGLRASVLHQAVEWPDTRWGLRDPADGPGYVQLVLRLGYGPPGATTPRRPVGEILDLTDFPEPTGPTDLQ